VYEVAAIELCIDSYRKIEPAHGIRRDLRIRDGRDVIATESDEHLGVPSHDGLERTHDGMALTAYWEFAEHSSPRVCRLDGSTIPDGSNLPLL
jgi:hypothetical protein